jgi:mono/diheme cytochrome c family protein
MAGSKLRTNGLARRNLVWSVAALAAVGLLAWWLSSGTTLTTVEVEVPGDLSPVAQAGQEAFQVQCAECHGLAAGGTEKGPPLVHKWYHPGHHADAAFVLAAKRGVPQHHWNFGNMPPQPQVGDRSLQQIIAYVRELQKANGIY